MQISIPDSILQSIRLSEQRIERELLKELALGLYEAATKCGVLAISGLSDTSSVTIGSTTIDEFVGFACINNESKQIRKPPSLLKLLGNFNHDNIFSSSLH
ncbi:hypothetical protein BWK47_14390 [Synechocystis sp. CACIAM 05]|nr:hypothetical protein BWK47_14390 [Synechocystis sp. CACIAM 05]